MNLKNLFILNAIVAIIFGIAFVLAPAWTASLYGVDVVSDALKYMAQLFGGCLVMIAVLTWMAKDADASDARGAIVLALIVGNTIGLIVALINQLANVVGGLGWLTVVVYLVLALGYAYFQFLKKPAA